MKQFATKERREERESFVYMHREEIKNMISFSIYVNINQRTIVREWIELKARGSLEYGAKTGWETIWFSLRRTYLHLKEKQLV